MKISIDLSNKETVILYPGTVSLEKREMHFTVFSYEDYDEVVWSDPEDVGDEHIESRILTELYKKLGN